ncbi:hypothetical protein [Maribacter aestuarii]|uniref:hypothetical protein n=1 Tax=Maribacter aestuarii TaxID=1130723 RepID=UPI00248C8A5B|nr:hypothetical protein [Maribacter aestuarii]
MKNGLFTLVLSIVFFSCSVEDYTEDDISLQYTTQKWELVRMTGSFPNSETTGAAMAWQEYYIFNPDGTFLKSRTVEGKGIEAKGTFQVMEYDNDEADYLELEFENGKELIGSCIRGDTETLVYRSSRALSNTWNACDGPGLDYSLVLD